MKKYNIHKINYTHKINYIKKYLKKYNINFTNIYNKININNIKKVIKVI